jgi:hypothetical protein
MFHFKVSFRQLGLVAGVLAVAGAYFCFAPEQINSQRRPPVRRSAPPPKAPKFDHFNEAHQMECSACHKFPSDNWKAARPAADAFEDITDYPKHETCLACHEENFFTGSPPTICSICHVNPSPNDSTRHPFPNPRELYDLSPKGIRSSSSFSVNFPHELHADIVSSSVPKGRADPMFVAVSFRQNAAENCAVCHSIMDPQGKDGPEFYSPPPRGIGNSFWLRRGTFMSSPLGHASCFICHSADSGMSPAPADCAACHKPRETGPNPDVSDQVIAKMKISGKVVRETWLARTSVGAFRHELEMHRDMECSTCHAVSGIDTVKRSDRRVSISSCVMCHVTATAAEGGLLNVELERREKNARFECNKCHVVYGKMPVPASHIKAVKDAGN